MFLLMTDPVVVIFQAWLSEIDSRPSAAHARASTLESHDADLTGNSQRLLPHTVDIEHHQRSDPKPSVTCHALSLALSLAMTQLAQKGLSP